MVESFCHKVVFVKVGKGFKPHELSGCIGYGFKL
jgi:hypothetical protein